MTNFDISHLANQNIWWDGAQNIFDDITIQKYNRSPLKWSPKVTQELEFGKDNIYIIRGPRQVGKTTALKLLIKSKLLEERVPAIALFYFTCDALETFHDLINVLETYLNYARLSYSGELFIFLDEISEIDKWQKAIKFLVDTGKLRNTTLFLTGSNAYDLKHSSERLPGRRGTSLGLDRTFFPLTFRDYLCLVDRTFQAQSEKFELFDVDAINDLVKRSSFKSLLVKKPRIDLFFDQYLLSGGFITAINDYHQNSSISPYIYEIYLQWVKGDFARYQKQERFLKQIIRRMIISLSSDIGWNSFTKDSEIGSHNTVVEYVDILEASFIARTVYNIDLNRQTANARKNKKFYILDNFIFHAFRGWLWAMNDPFKASKKFLAYAENKSKLVENCTFMHFHQLFGEEMYFWKNKTEVDFVGKKNGKLYFFELKYRTQPRIKHFEQFFRMTNRPLVVLTRDEFRVEQNLLMIPVSLMLAVI